MPEVRDGRTSAPSAHGLSYDNVSAGQWLEVQRQALLGQIAAIVVHEFNNLMTPVLTWADQARTTGRLSERGLDYTLDNTQRAVGIARRLLTFAQQPNADPRPCDPDEALEAALRMLGRPLQRDNIALEAQLAGSPAVLAEPLLLQQYFLNMTVDVREELVPAGGQLCFSATPARDAVILTARASGAGIGAERTRRIAAFFESCRDPDCTTWKAIGLNMTACRLIASVHDGQLAVEGEPGVRRISLRLPLAVAGSARRQASAV